MIIFSASVLSISRVVLCKCNDSDIDFYTFSCPCQSIALCLVKFVYIWMYGYNTYMELGNSSLDLIDYLDEVLKYVVCDELCRGRRLGFSGDWLDLIPLIALGPLYIIPIISNLMLIGLVKINLVCFALVRINLWCALLGNHVLLLRLLWRLFLHILPPYGIYGIRGKFRVSIYFGTSQ